MARRVGLIGCGSIGGEIVKAIASGVVKAELVGLFDIYPERCRSLLESTGISARIVEGLEELLELKPDLVVEAASQEAVRRYATRILEAGVDLVVMSVGALLDPKLAEALREASARGGARVYAPTGAIAALDAIRAAKLSGIKRILLRTVKNPKSLGVEASSRRILFRGPASEAVKRFPFNVNVAAALTLASGVEVEVEVVADPSVGRNTHIIIVESNASRIEVKVENVPSPSNPKTSWLAALSAVELLRRLTGGDWLVVGS